MADAMSSSQPGPNANDKRLFLASFLTLVAAGIGFSVRALVIKDWGNEFGFTQSELGGISGGGLIGFGVAIIFFSFFADRFGYGKLMLIAFLLHASSAMVTFAASPVYASMGKEGAFTCLNLGMWLFSFGNGTCEAVINPLTATLFSRNKTHWLNILHAGWPLGLILGAVIGLVFGQVGAVAWEIKLGIFLVPVLAYGYLAFNKPFPKSEANVAGIPLVEMMKPIGMVGFAIGAIFLGLALPNLLGSLGLKVPGYVGYVAALGLWALYAAYSKFALGSILIACLFVLHALVGYVELGTDSWIVNITTRVLANENYALLASIWINSLMFTLRFFAGPIVHKINPIGLLIISATLGSTGLYLLGNPDINTIGLWMAASTIFAIGKTFYWPTLLGVISERFPKSGALALGISGGVGMLCAGLLGVPGIGYKQDNAAVTQIKAASNETYERYVSRDEKGEHSKTGFPVVTDIVPDIAPEVAGLDNGKLKVFDDYRANLGTIKKEKEKNTSAEKMPVLFDGKFDDYIAAFEKSKEEKKPAPNVLMTTLESDIVTMLREKKSGKKVGEKLEKNLNGLYNWWLKDGKPNFEKDTKFLDDARDHGARRALTLTALVPAAMAIGFLLLWLYFKSIGGYKQVHLDGQSH